MSARLHVALLRGINVGGHNRIRMAELRELCAELGWQDARSYIQSGNLVFSAAGTTRALELQLERAIQAQLELSIPVLVRTASSWKAHMDRNPFAEVSDADPKRVMLALSKQKPVASALAALQERAANGETIAREGDALWFDCPNGVGRSKLTPAFMDRAVGSTVTARNWRTVLELGELLTRK